MNTKEPYNCLECGDQGEIDGYPCQECCNHSEHEHYSCLDCGREMEPSDFFNEDEGLDR